LHHFRFQPLFHTLAMAWRASVGSIFRKLNFSFNEKSSSAWGVAGFLEANYSHLKAHNPDLPVCPYSFIQIYAGPYAGLFRFKFAVLLIRSHSWNALLGITGSTAFCLLLFLE
jgi:hypothetical protein